MSEKTKAKGLIETVFEFIEDMYGVPEKDLIGLARSKQLSQARRHAYVIFAEAGVSLVCIGDIMGYRSHSTVIGALKRISEEDQDNLEKEFHAWKTEKTEKGYMLVELSFPDGTAYTGVTRMISGGEIREAALELGKKFQCQIKVLRRGLSRAAARDMETVEIMKQKLTGG